MFNGKHTLYGYKTYVSVLLNSLVIGLSVHYLGLCQILTSLTKGEIFHDAQLKKRDDEKYY